jgi:hypothetical protein
MRKGGASYREIGSHLGVSTKTAHQYVMRELERLAEEAHEEAAQVRVLELQRLDRMLRGLWLRARDGDTFAVDRVLKMMERRARLLGLDAPAMLAADVTTRVDPIEELPEERKLELIRQCLAAAESEHEAVDDGAADDDDGGSG